MSFVDAVKAVLTNYVGFTGRARRSEYWWFFLFNILVSIVASIFDKAIGAAVLGTLTSLALLLPGIAVGIRRLHDTDRSGWWLLISLTIVGIIPLLVFLAQEGQAGANKYGGDPKAGAGSNAPAATA
jgi:uncharacterized membrane protein YhaH (DUF805 family)